MQFFKQSLVILICITAAMLLGHFLSPQVTAQDDGSPLWRYHLCGAVDGTLCKSASGTVLGTIGTSASSYASCGSNAEVCCPNGIQATHCPNVANVCGVRTGSGNCSVQLGSQTLEFATNVASCGTGQMAGLPCCLYEQDFCPNKISCGNWYTPATTVCSCNGADDGACCGWQNTNNAGSNCLAAPPTNFSCGQAGFDSRNPTHRCTCPGYLGGSTCNPPPNACSLPARCTNGNASFCTSNGGREADGVCAAGSVCCDFTPLPPPPGDGGGDQPVPPPGEGGDAGAGPTLNIFAGPSNADFAFLNPLRMFSTPALADQFSSPAGIINRILVFAFPLAGLILFVMIVWGGFEMITGATNSKSMEAGKQRITAALIGFGLLFASFWIIQIVEYIFNIAIL